jgi:ABC-type polysaccharide/polyol phosphate export permease
LWLKKRLEQKGKLSLENNILKRLSRNLAYLFISLAIIFMLTFNLIGSEVDAAGVLQEPFFLIPFSYVSFALGIVFAVISVVKKKKN